MEQAKQLAAAKQALRHIMKERRKELDPAYCHTADERIRAAVLALPVYRTADRLFVYVSMPGEPDTRALIAAALEAGKRVYVPKCPDRKTMLAARIGDLAELAPGRLSIPEPGTISEIASAEELDLMLIPCVTACRDGRRLGHGAGYYDRFLQSGHGLKICLCYGRMLSETLPAGPMDVRMDAVITEDAADRIG